MSTRSPDSSPPHDIEHTRMCLPDEDPAAAELSEEQRELLRATLAWEPGGKPLEQDEAVQAYIRRHPQNLEGVRALERFLARGRAVRHTDEPRPGAQDR